MSRLIELEGLLIGITGKIGLWETLTELGAGPDLGIDVEATDGASGGPTSCGR